MDPTKKLARRWTLALLLAMAKTAVAQTNSAADPFLATNAVSAFNARLDYSGGDMNSSVGHLFDASFTLPLAHQFGFQADAMYSRIDNLNFASGAGHLFWRNPNIGLLGLTGGYLTGEVVDTYQGGLEGEYYLGRFTLGFFGGVGTINYDHPVPFIATNPTRFVGRLSADYYPIDNLRVGVSYTTAFENNLGRGEIEYQTPIPGLALTAEVAYGDHDYHHWLFGVRYYFGGHKSLRDRQRQDDPPGLTRAMLYDLGAYGAGYNQKADGYAAAHPGSGGSGWGSYGSTIISAPANPIQAYPIQATPVQRNPIQYNPHQGCPLRGYPDRGYPDRGYPDRGYPDRGYPDRGYPDRRPVRP